MAIKLPKISKSHIVLFLSLLLNLLGGTGTLPPGLGLMDVPAEEVCPPPAPVQGVGGVAPAGGAALLPPAPE